MKKILVLLLLATQAQAIEVVRKDEVELYFDGRMQLFGFAQRVDDAYADHNRFYLFVKQARLNFNGRYDDIRFNVELALGGEDQVLAPSPGVTLGLLDFSFDLPSWGDSFFRFGQFKVPYGRERLTYSGNLNFADRSPGNLMFQVGRDVGAAWHAGFGDTVGAVGIFTGGGKDIPIRYLPEHLGTPMLALRAGWNAGYDKDAFTPSTLDPRTKGDTAQAFFLNAYGLQDSAVGHSTVLNVKMSDKALLTNTNWNPYIGATPFSQGYVWGFSADYAARTGFGASVASAEAELNYGAYSNARGRLYSAGGRAQLAWQRDRWQLGLRYNVTLPDSQFAISGMPITGSQPFHELTPALVYFIKGVQTKLILDLPYQIGVPVVTETGVGAYVLTEQPDQVTVLKGGKGTLDRQNVVEGRVLLQFAF